MSATSDTAKFLTKKDSISGEKVCGVRLVQSSLVLQKQLVVQILMNTRMSNSYRN
jgi:hypothetical protein